MSLRLLRMCDFVLISDWLFYALSARFSNALAASDVSHVVKLNEVFLWIYPQRFAEFSRVHGKSSNQS